MAGGFPETGDERIETLSGQSAVENCWGQSIISPYER